MKKLSIVLLAVFFIGIANVNAQNIFGNSSKEGQKTDTKEIKCIKTGKICDATCKNKAKGTCCNGKAKKSCSKSKKSSCSKKAKKGCCKSNNSSCSKNNASKSCSKSKASCSKKAKKGCCKKKPCCKGGDNCKKPCCVPPPPTMEDATPAETEEAAPEKE